eukprot:2023623-Prymnesium_polylepis.1
MHAFGAWLANIQARYRYKGDMYERKAVSNNINLWRASNGEEIHGNLWQSLRLLAHEGGTLEGRRIPNPNHEVAVAHAHTICEPTWYLSPQYAMRD